MDGPPVDPVVVRGVSLLLSKTPESTRKMFDLMAEHNHLPASLVDVWLGKGSYRGGLANHPLKVSTEASSSPSMGLLSDTTRATASAPTPTSAPSLLLAQLQQRGVKRDGRPKAKNELFAPDMPNRLENKPSKPMTDVSQNVEPSDSTGLFSVPDNIKKKPSSAIAETNPELDVKRPPQKLKLSPHGISRPNSSGRNSPRPLPSSALPKDAGSGTKTAGGRLKMPLINLTASDDERSSHGSTPDGMSPGSARRSSSGSTSATVAVGKSPAGAYSNGDGIVTSGDESDGSPMRSFAERHLKGRKRSHAVIVSDGSDSDTLESENGGGVPPPLRSVLPARKSRPPASKLLDGISLSEDSDDDSMASRPSSPSNSSSAGPSPSSSSSSIKLKAGLLAAAPRPRPQSKLPLKLKGATPVARPNTAQTPDTPIRSGGITPTGSVRPPFVSQTSRGSTSGSGGASRHPSSSSSGNRNLVAMRKQAQKLSNLRRK